jgi:hypothetical protein
MVTGARSDRDAGLLAKRLAALEAQLRNQTPVHLPVRNAASGGER